MKPLRQLVSQTAIYGLSSIVARFLNYLLVPLYTYKFNTGEYGVVSEFYAYAGFFSVVLVFGLETGYFRFRQDHAFSRDSVYTISLGFLLVVNLIFFAAFFWGREPLASWLHYPAHPEYIYWFAGILSLDALGALPFAWLRAENRPWRFAIIKVAEIALTIVLNLFFLWFCPKLLAIRPDLWLNSFYDPHMGVGYIFLSNLIASFFKIVLLFPQFCVRLKHLEIRILPPIMRYSSPMVVIGLAGMTNEMLDRAILKTLLPYDISTNLKMLGIYGACYKLSILMSLFVQAFRYAGEPFFFSYAQHADAKHIYALVMRYFVITGVCIFLTVSLFLDFFQNFIGPEFRVGLAVVPILLLANLCLGIYANLSVWYKLSDRTGLGAWVSVAGAILTVTLNILWIPSWGYMGSAWATLVCYGFMVALSWLLGRRYYPVPYPLGAIAFYLGYGLLLYFANLYLVAEHGWNNRLSATLCLMLYILLVGLLEITLYAKRN